MNDNNYQARLNKVLSVFAKVHSNNYNYDLKDDFLINYGDKKFTLISTSEICLENCFLDISLSTVESLLKDLGVIK